MTRAPLVGTPPPEVNARPQCPQCDKRLRPFIDGGYGGLPREWRGSYHQYGAFCSLKCCERFANAAFKAGYRIKR